MQRSRVRPSPGECFVAVVQKQILKLDCTTIARSFLDVDLGVYSGPQNATKEKRTSHFRARPTRPPQTFFSFHRCDMSSSSDPSASTASSSSSESGATRRPRHRYHNRSRSLDQSRSAGEEHRRSRYRSSRSRSSGRSHSADQEEIQLDGSEPRKSQLPTEVENVAALPPAKDFCLDQARSKELRGCISMPDAEGSEQDHEGRNGESWFPTVLELVGEPTLVLPTAGILMGPLGQGHPLAGSLIQIAWRLSGKISKLLAFRKKWSNYSCSRGVSELAGLAHNSIVIDATGAKLSLAMPGISQRSGAPLHVLSLKRLVLATLEETGIDTSIYSDHSTRGSSTSKAASTSMSIEGILRAESWRSESTFTRFYRRQKDLSLEANTVRQAALRDPIKRLGHRRKPVIGKGEACQEATAINLCGLKDKAPAS
ncbi:hypothetical protein OUZ56_026408 [Daphnia magna]|uniref:Uncharacterized protein n=1 Tax=Daphnia magna TaxID=35525 RepID=A0ABQ9ZN08_9CRUS|nr:hypothetical protein OUZ56_026408 [Daphnia magna]